MQSLTAAPILFFFCKAKIEKILVLDCWKILHHFFKKKMCFTKTCKNYKDNKITFTILSTSFLKNKELKVTANINATRSKLKVFCYNRSTYLIYCAQNVSGDTACYICSNKFLCKKETGNASLKLWYKGISKYIYYHFTILKKIHGKSISLPAIS